MKGLTWLQWRLLLLRSLRKLGHALKTDPGSAAAGGSEAGVTGKLKAASSPSLPLLTGLGVCGKVLQHIKVLWPKAAQSCRYVQIIIRYTCPCNLKCLLSNEAEVSLKKELAFQQVTFTGARDLQCFRPVLSTSKDVKKLLCQPASSELGSALFVAICPTSFLFEAAQSFGRNGS